MQPNPVKLDAARAWSDAMTMLKAAPDVLLTVAGFFIMLPMLLLDMFRPMTLSGARGTALQEMLAWTEANILWIVLAAVIGALGRLAILVMLLEPSRPTAGESLAAAARLLVLFVATDLVIGLLWMGGAMLFVLPWLYLIGRTFLAEATFVAERARSPIAAIAAGFEASRGNGWRIFIMVAIIYVAQTVSVACWMMSAYFDTIPISLEEAAWMDGTSVLGGFFRVVLRNSLPGVLSTAIYSFLLAWNDYLVALVFIRSSYNFTLPIGIQTFFQLNQTDWGPVMACAVVMLAPPVVVFAVFNRFFSVGGIGGALAGR